MGAATRRERERFFRVPSTNGEREERERGARATPSLHSRQQQQQQQQRSLCCCCWRCSSQTERTEKKRTHLARQSKRAAVGVGGVWKGGREEEGEERRSRKV